MLTLKAPIQLHITQPLTTGTDSFGERVRGNYSLLSAHLTPKDLLFLMTATPELPEELGGMTTLVNQQNQVDIRSISMDVVNNVVNRILLDGTQQFTYQDQVYITTVLNRLGITNVAQFMGQVRRLRVENESTVHMAKLYRDEIERLVEHRAAGERVPALPLPPREDEAESLQQPDPRLLLALDILNRLDTTQIYETVHAFQHSWTGGDTVIRNQELRLSEQLRFSNQIDLAELKQTLYQQPRLELQHHINVYEAGLVSEAPQTEEAVLSQAAAAALLSAVDNTVVQVLNRPGALQERWLQVENAFWQTAENTLVRFEDHHTQPHTLLVRETESRDAWYHYARELLEYQTLHRLLTPDPGTSQLTAPLPADRVFRTSSVLEQTEEGDMIHRHSHAETLNETLDRLEQRIEAVYPLQAVKHTDTLRQTVLRQRELERQTETRKLRETILQKLHPKSSLPLPQASSPAPTVFRSAEEPLEAEAPAERLLHTRQLQQEIRTDRERLEQLIEHSESIAPPPSTAQPSVSAELPKKTEEALRTSPPAMPELPLVPLRADEAEEQAPEILLKELNRIDQRNRTLLQTLQSKSQAAPPSPLAQPDLQQTMRSALRALDEPETVLQELYEARERQQAKTIHPSPTPQEEFLLEQAPPQERALYEAILTYQKDPERALAQGLLHPASQAALQAALQSRPSPQDSLALEHLDAEDVQPDLIRETAQSVLEHIVHAPKPRMAAAEEPLSPSAVRFIHKQLAPDVTEELLEQLTEHHRSESLRTESTEQRTHQQSHQIDINQIEKKVVSQTTEDITELVNRTLARQMRTISDQVYRQMEKRLQTERSRRGRM